MPVDLGAYGATGTSGWSVYTPSKSVADGGSHVYSTNIIYASKSLGSDLYNGSAPTHTGGINGPVKTIGKAIGGNGPGAYDPDDWHEAGQGTPVNGDGTGLGSRGAGNSFALRSGCPDWVLLHKGDDFSDEFITTGWVAATASNDQFQKDGYSDDEPMLISNYDPDHVDGDGNCIPDPVSALPRPIIRPPIAYGASLITIAGSGSNYVHFVGLDGYASWRDPDHADFVDEATVAANPIDGISSSSNCIGLRVENCRLKFFGYNLSFNLGSVMTLHRVVSVNAWKPAGFAQGAYIQDVPYTIIQECFFDHNGWNKDFLDADWVRGRNLYVHLESHHLTYQGVISTRSASEGCQFRAENAQVLDSYFGRNPIGFTVGHNEANPTVLDMIVRYNVVQESVDDFIAGTNRGMGICVENANGSGVQVTANILSHGIGVQSNANWAQLDSWSDGGSPSDGTHGITLTGNIVYKWHLGLLDDGSGDGHGSANVTSPNDVDLTGAGSHPTFIDPERKLADYARYLGLTVSEDDDVAFQAFVDAATDNCKDNWNPLLTANAVNNWIRPGFGQAAYPVVGGPVTHRVTWAA